MVNHISNRNALGPFNNDTVLHFDSLIENKYSSDSCEHEEDEFISSDSVQSGSEISNGISGIFNNFCERLSGIFNVFSPLLSFIKNLSDSQNVINNFNNLLQSAEQNVNGQGLLSRESKQALDELTSTVSQLQQNNNNVNLGNIIAQWRATGNAQHLLQMAEHIEGGRCVSLNESELKELREAFISGLRSLARAIRDAEEKGESHALEHLHDAANPLVSGVERAHQASQREETRLTYEDRRFMEERLQESCDCVDEGMRNGVFNGLDRSVLNELNSWTNYVYDFLIDFFERIEKEREEEEKAEKEEQCKKRCEEKEEIRFLHALHKEAENKKLRFLSLMKQAIREANFALGIARAESNNVVVNHARHNMEIDRARREYGNSLCAEDMYKKQAGLESYFEGSEQDIVEALPPSSVCNESPIGFIFDVHC